MFAAATPTGQLTSMKPLQNRFLIFKLIAPICCVIFSSAVVRGQTLGDALDATNFTWTTFGNSDWFYQTIETHDGIAAAQSGAVMNNQFSVLQTTITGPGTLMYWWELVRFNQGSYEFILLIDGIQQAKCYGPWTYQTNFLGDGPHVVEWAFTNDFESGTLQDFAAVDQVSFIPGTTAPSITIQPANQTQAARLSTTFTVTATGTPPMSYQWQFNRTNVPGAQSSSLTITNTQSSNSGSYSVIVSNIAGSTLSSNAFLSLVTVAAWPGVNTVPLVITNALAIAVGDSHCLALKTDGTVIGWGNNGGGQISIPTGLTNAVAIAAGKYHSLALRAEGSVISWGRNDYGQTNVPTTATNVIAIAAGGDHCLALRADGNVVGWGDNYQGQSNVPNSLSNVVAISAGLGHSMALRADGRIITWGWNYNGITNVPVALTSAVAIAAGFTHSLALKPDGTVVAWGDSIAGGTTVPAGLSGVSRISGGTFSSLAVKVNGIPVGWGYQTALPTGLANVSAVAAGGYQHLAIVEDGSSFPRASFSNPTWSNNTFRVTMPTRCGRVYQLEYTTTLTDPNWIALPLVPGNGAAQTLKDLTAIGSRRFYRVREW